jgi:hypothetical protein
MTPSQSKIKVSTWVQGKAVLQGSRKLKADGMHRGLVAKQTHVVSGGGGAAGSNTEHQRDGLHTKEQPFSKAGKVNMTVGHFIVIYICLLNVKRVGKRMDKSNALGTAWDDPASGTELWK